MDYPSIDMEYLKEEQYTIYLVIQFLGVLFTITMVGFGGYILFGGVKWIVSRIVGERKMQIWWVDVRLQYRWLQ